MNFISLIVLISVVPTFAESPSINDLAMGKVEKVTCPAVSDEYGKMLAKLDALKSSIKSGSNCGDVTSRVNQFQGLSKDRDRFLQLIKKSETEMLSDSESREIGNYTETITEKASALIDYITNSTQCFQGDVDKQALTALSGFVSEAASLLSSVGGPWSAPIAIGGQVIAGFITGLDKIMKSRAGYDFRDRDQWMSYLQNLCTYANLHPEIEALLHPETRIAQLLEISRKLDGNMLQINSICSECSQITSAPAPLLSDDKIVKEVDASHVPKLGTLTAKVRAAQYWVKSEIDRVQANGRAYWNKVSGKSVLAKATQEMEDFLLENQAPKFLSFQMSQSKHGFYDLSNFMFSDGSTLLEQAKKANLIEDPPQINLKAYFGKNVAIPTNDGSSIFRGLTSVNWRAKYQKLNRNPDDLAFRLINGSKVAKQKFDTASWSFGVAYAFCDYFEQAEMYSSPVQQSCSTEQFKDLNQTVVNMLGDVKPDYEKPAAGTGPHAISWTDSLDQWATSVQSSLAAPQLQ